MEIHKSTNQPWAFTYKKLGHTVCTIEDYAGVVDQLNKYGFVKYVQGEQDPQGKFHIHGIVLLRRGFMRKKLLVPSFHCCLREVYDEEDWLRYCNKDTHKPRTPYLFDPIYVK